LGLRSRHTNVIDQTYRERKKKELGQEYFDKEKKRVKEYYIPTKELSKKDHDARNLMKKEGMRFVIFSFSFDNFRISCLCSFIVFLTLVFPPILFPAEKAIFTTRDSPLSFFFLSREGVK
jgi:hypothetical protein